MKPLKDSKKNPNNVGMMCFSLYMRSTDNLGGDVESRRAYFEKMVNSGYFNQYLLPMDDWAVMEAEIIAKAGGSFWFITSKDGEMVENSLDEYIQRIENRIKELEAAGLEEYLNGFFWDEPLLGSRISNDQFLKLTRVIYEKFGLRNFAVFATGEFTRLEGNEDELPPDIKIGKITTHGMRYLTDVGFDAYSTDVRDEAPNGGAEQYKIWQKEISPNVVDGKSYYTEHRRLITERAGHPVNYWHFPCTWDDGLYGGVDGIMTADEGYWNAHLDLLAQDVLDYDYPGGICLYTFRRVDKDTRVCFERRMDLKDENGNWLVWPEVEKFTEYSEKVRYWNKKLSETKVKITDIK